MTTTCRCGSAPSDSDTSPAAATTSWQTLRSKGFMDDSDTGSPVSWTFLTASCATFASSARRAAR